MTIKARAATASAAATAITIVLVIAGSRGLRDFDAALIGYAVATLFAVAALTYRYALWIGRVPTGHYFRAGWATFFSWRNFRRYTLLVPKALWTDLIGQTFIRKRSNARWLTHQAIFWGVVLSVAVTVPLTFGWIRFTLVPPDGYRAWFFGFPVMTFPIEARTGFAAFHILDFTAVLLIAGVVAAIVRRMRDVGLLTTQRFGFDLMPLILLLAIAVTGLGADCFVHVVGRGLLLVHRAHASDRRGAVVALAPVRKVLSHHRATGERRRHAVSAGGAGYGAL